MVIYLTIGFLVVALKLITVTKHKKVLTITIIDIYTIIANICTWPLYVLLIIIHMFVDTDKELFRLED